MKIGVILDISKTHLLTRFKQSAIAALGVTLAEHRSGGGDTGSKCRKQDDVQGLHKVGVLVALSFSSGPDSWPIR